jgi:hypothetical protein
METTERCEVETEAIGRALQHDFVLRGHRVDDEQMIFEWCSPGRTTGPRFDDRDLAIEWMIDWLAYDTPYGDN